MGLTFAPRSEQTYCSTCTATSCCRTASSTGTRTLATSCCATTAGRAVTYGYIRLRGGYGAVTGRLQGDYIARVVSHFSTRVFVAQDSCLWHTAHIVLLVRPATAILLPTVSLLYPTGCEVRLFSTHLFRTPTTPLSPPVTHAPSQDRVDRLGSSQATRIATAAAAGASAHLPSRSGPRAHRGHVARGRVRDGTPAPVGVRQVGAVTAARFAPIAREMHSSAYHPVVVAVGPVVVAVGPVVVAVGPTRL